MKELKVTDEMYEKIKHLVEEDKNFKADFESKIEEKLFIRTVTYHSVGRVKRIFAEEFLELEDASWVADSGRFMNAIKEGILDEVEPVGQVYVNIKSIIDFFPWNHELPKEQK